MVITIDRFLVAAALSVCFLAGGCISSWRSARSPSNRELLEAMSEQDAAGPAPKHRPSEQQAVESETQGPPTASPVGTSVAPTGDASSIGLTSATASEESRTPFFDKMRARLSGEKLKEFDALWHDKSEKEREMVAMALAAGMSSQTSATPVAQDASPPYNATPPNQSPTYTRMAQPPAEAPIDSARYRFQAEPTWAAFQQVPAAQKRPTPSPAATTMKPYLDEPQVSGVQQAAYTPDSSASYGVAPAGYREMPRAEGGMMSASESRGLEAVGAAANAASTSAANLEETNWRQSLARTIRQLELRLAKPDPNDVTKREHLETYLRLLYLASSEPDHAVVAIESYSEEKQAFWSNLIHAMQLELEPNNQPADRRALATLDALKTAQAELAQVASLSIKNLTICETVHGYGDFEKFKRSTFEPNQRVLLYFEVDNLKTVQSHKGHEAKLVGSIQILDQTTRPRASLQFPSTKDVCENRRRDFFVRYVFDVPPDLEPGDYTLSLSVNDVHGKKFGMSAVDFTVR